MLPWRGRTYFTVSSVFRATLLLVLSRASLPNKCSTSVLEVVTASPRSKPRGRYLLAGFPAVPPLIFTRYKGGKRRFQDGRPVQKSALWMAVWKPWQERNDIFYLAKIHGQACCHCGWHSCRRWCIGQHSQRNKWNVGCLQCNWNQVYSAKISRINSAWCSCRSTGSTRSSSCFVEGNHVSNSFHSISTIGKTRLIRPKLDSKMVFEATFRALLLHFGFPLRWRLNLSSQDACRFKQQ